MSGAGSDVQRRGKVKLRTGHAKSSGVPKVVKWQGIDFLAEVAAAILNYPVLQRCVCHFSAELASYDGI